MNLRLSNPDLRKWFEGHPSAGKTVRFTLGVLFAILWMSLMHWLKPWLPTWLPRLGGICAIGLGLFGIAGHIRNPVPQGQPEDGLFTA
ncbi:MAG: hypothetical protein WDN24_10775 [Sphingomonas sp.]